MSMTTNIERQVLSAQHLEQYEQNGFHIGRGLLAPDEAAEIRETFMSLAANGPVPGLSETRRNSAPSGYDANDPLARYPRMMHPHRHPEYPVGPLAMRYMLDRRIEAVLWDLFGEEPIAAQSMFYFKPPGARGQALHQDNFYLRVHPGTCMAAWIAVDDADEANGGMVVVPGSHKLDIVCPEKADSTRFFTSEHVEPPPGYAPQPVTLNAGDVLFFNGSIIHGSYPNTSADRFRRALICHYVPQGCIEVSQFYRPLLRFNGEPTEKDAATGGGPCGTPVDAVTSPH